MLSSVYQYAYAIVKIDVLFFTKDYKHFYAAGLIVSMSRSIKDKSSRNVRV